MAPKSFIQIHYHNRPGGVTTVMERYSGVFNRTSRSNIRRSFIICNNYSKKTYSNYEVIPVQECDYHRFHTKKAFLLIRQRLFRKLTKLLSNKELPRPVCIVAHNLSLGKNIALSAAFSDLIDLFKSDNEVRFYSVIHDMAEEGRSELLSHIRDMEFLGIPVWDYLYPKGYLEYIVLNKRNYKLFSNAKFPVTLLPNPIKGNNETRNLSQSERRKVYIALSKLSKKDNTNFIPSAETVFYPVRIISRKNVLEAIIKVCVIHKANLLIGSPGTSGYDKKLYKKIGRLSQRYNLPVIPDIERIREYLPDKLTKVRSVLELLYSYSDWCITTSIVEGFGYALYEPWMYYKKVTGRLPLGISRSELIDFSHLHDNFYIPVSWLPVEELVNQYYLEIKRTFGKEVTLLNVNEFKNHFMKSFIYNGTIDFSVLNQEMQYEVLKKLIADKGRLRAELKNLNDGISKWERDNNITEEIDTVYIEKNRKAIINNLTGSSFDKRFKECFYNIKPCMKRGSGKGRSFISHFSSLSEFRLLMSNS